MATSSIYAITGRPVSTADKPLRREIDEWYASQDPNDVAQVALFVLALLKLEEVPVTEKLSYFQIAGIHGQPYVPWDEKTSPQNPDQGYCTHNSVLFPTWHRPYLALYEQRLYEIMVQDIIPTWANDTNRAQWASAAEIWRLPYWDWAARKIGSDGSSDYNVPQIVRDPQIQIVTAAGPTQQKNPMYMFTMPNGEPMGNYGITPEDQFAYDQCVGTSRWPATPGDDLWIQGVENNDDAVNALRGGSFSSKSIREVVYRMFSPNYLPNYDAFATTKYLPQQRQQAYLSLEGIHNNIHSWTGGDGQMALPTIAAFDPIFWMHHNNVDRQFAIWQTLNPNKWFEVGSQQLPDDGNWSIPSGAIDTPTTALAPFHTDNAGNFWTSDECRDWLQLGYSYPELQPWLPKYNPEGKAFDHTLYISDLTKAINSLYGSTRQLMLNSPQNFVKAPSGPRPASQTILATTHKRDLVGQDPIPQTHGTPQTNGISQTSGVPHTNGADLRVEEERKVEHDDYIVNVLYDRSDLGGLPYTVHVFVGSADNLSGSNTYQSHPAKVGDVYNFSASHGATEHTSGGCANCRLQEKAGVKATGQVPITNALLKDVNDNGKPLDSLNPAQVEAYLRDNLHWRVTTLGGREVPLESLPSLKVSVAAGKGVHYEGQLSQYHSYTVMHSVTHGRVGGLSTNGTT